MKANNTLDEIAKAAMKQRELDFETIVIKKNGYHEVKTITTNKINKFIGKCVKYIQPIKEEFIKDTQPLKERLTIKRMVCLSILSFILAGML